jgi:hypothetical protein
MDWGASRLRVTTIANVGLFCCGRRFFGESEKRRLHGGEWDSNYQTTFQTVSKA